MTASRPGRNSTATKFLLRKKGALFFGRQKAGAFLEILEKLFQRNF